MTKEMFEKLVDVSERADGPPLIALWGDNIDAELRSQFRLGTREYDWHSHLRGQLFCIESGLVHARTAHGSWLLPPQRAGWIPPGEPHQADISGVMSGWSVLIAPDACRGLPDKPCVIGVSELMRALVRRAVSWSEQDQLSPAQRRVMNVLLDEVRQAPHQPLHLPLPTDRRLLRIVSAIMIEPADNRTLEQWAEWAGLSPRTMSRLFRQEVGCSFAQWRQQALLTHALERLARGEQVAAVADALGYASPSNFIVMFRRCFGESPGRYFHPQNSGGT